MAYAAIKITGEDEIKNALQNLIVKQNTFATIAAQHLAIAAKMNIQQQIDVQNKAFIPRKNNKNKPLLLGLMQGIEVLNTTESSAEVGFKNSYWGMIAKRHNSGGVFLFTPHKNKKQLPKIDYDLKASLAQKAILQSLGYAKNMQNMKTGQAGLIIRSMRGLSAEKKITPYEIPLPQREFMAVTEQLVTEIKNDIIEQSGR